MNFYHILKHIGTNNYLAVLSTYYSSNYCYYVPYDQYLRQSLSCFFEQGYYYFSDIEANNTSDAVRLIKQNDLENQIKELEDVLSAKIDKKLALDILMLNENYDAKLLSEQFKKINKVVHPDKNILLDGTTPSNAILSQLINKAKDVLSKNLG